MEGESNTDAGNAAGTSGQMPPPNTAPQGAADGAAAATTQPTAAPEPKVTAGRIVTLTHGEHAPFDGESTSVAIVAKVLDDGSLNVYAFAPNGGASTFMTGVKKTSDVDAMPDGADKNAARTVTWDWPSRA